MAALRPLGPDPMTMARLSRMQRQAGAADQEGAGDEGEPRGAEPIEGSGTERGGEDEEGKFEAREEGLPFEVEAEEQERGDESGGVASPVRIADGACGGDGEEE